MAAINDSESKNIMARLKRETAEIHQKIESLMPFTDESFSLAEYKRLLVNFYGLYENLEPQIERALERYSVNFDYHQRLKTPKLKADLQNLQIPFPQIPNATAPDKTTAFDSKEKIFGALYVIEGSTLGGQIISKILKQKFALDETNGAAFFNGYGSDTGAMWNDFRAVVTKIAETSERHDELIAAAAETFRQFGQVITQR